MLGITLNAFISLQFLSSCEGASICHFVGWSVPFGLSLILLAYSETPIGNSPLQSFKVLSSCSAFQYITLSVSLLSMKPIVQFPFACVHMILLFPNILSDCQNISNFLIRSSFKMWIQMFQDMHLIQIGFRK